VNMQVMHMIMWYTIQHYEALNENTLKMVGLVPVPLLYIAA